MFSNVLFSVVAFIVALGILVAIHEFGHFWVARKVGVKVLRFSVGFGKALWTRVGKKDDTEFVVAAIPLGGYVKMLDEREAPVLPSEQSRAFNRQPLWARTAVVIAGPMANFLLAIAAYWIVMMIGISGVAPVIGDVAPSTPAALGGFQAEDRILAINNNETQSWTEARIALLEGSLDADRPLLIRVETANGAITDRELDVGDRQLLKESGDLVANLGFSSWWPAIEPVMGRVVPGDPASVAGVEAGDKVLAVDGAPIQTWREFVTLVQPSAGKAMQLLIERQGQELQLNVTPQAIEVNGQTIGRIGVAETQSAGMLEKLRVKVQYPPLEGLVKAFQRTWEMTLLTLRMLGKLLSFQASIDNISGPISIAQFAGQSAQIGIDHYINFIAMISISLAVLNLLPIPMLDGGHLLYFAAEAVMRKPVSERVQIMGQQLGLVLLGCLMFVAFYNDIFRLVQ